MKIQESAENYLEAILVITQETGSARSIDVARRLGVSKPSVSRAVGLLRERGHLTVAPDGQLLLTEQGYAIADRIYERHRLFTAWLIQLGVTPQVAAEDACRIEHDISQETFDRIKAHIEKSLGRSS